VATVDLCYLLRGGFHLVFYSQQSLHVDIMSDKMRPTFGLHDTTDASFSDHAQSQAVIESVVIDDKGIPTAVTVIGAAGSVWSEGLDEDAQLGVKNAQATTLTWTKTALHTTLSW
jgi:hypothetical protein